MRGNLHPRRFNSSLKALFVGLGLGLGACSSASASITVATPTQEAMSWFQSVNNHNLQASLAHFAPAERSQGFWDMGQTDQWPHFAGVNCAQERPQSPRTDATHAVVRCTFHVEPSPGGDNSAVDDTFWSIDFQRNGTGPWLIVGNGQP